MTQAFTCLFAILLDKSGDSGASLRGILGVNWIFAANLGVEILSIFSGSLGDMWFWIDLVSSDSLSSSSFPFIWQKELEGVIKGFVDVVSLDLSGSDVMKGLVSSWG